ncbi:MAG TPA: TonB-dependent receptor [Novosphingobium sp.]|nr:TonB-dependent receptor [Novosphingobium sp.]
MRFKTFSTTAASTLAIGIAVLSTPAFAQSTGSIDFDKEIVVSGSRTTQNVGGISSPDTAKAKAVLTQEVIQRANPGQTVLDTINQIPGVTFQNNDAYGSSGGTLNIRGFSSDRVSLTFDGIPLNDSGNYAIFSNQQVDPELIEQVNVNLGTTDVDSPTASAVGGTVNYRTLTPSHDFGVKLSGSAGQFEFMRMFAKIETGDLTSSGTRAWFSASRATNNLPFNNYGRVNKQQYNAKIYQPLGGDDFISLAGHWNQNRNNFFGSLPLRIDTTRLATVNGVPNVVVPRIVGPLSQNRYPTSAAERRYLINYPCSLSPARAGLADTPAASTLPGGGVDTNGDYASCGTEFDRRYNPSNTGNVRLASRFSLSDKLTLTADLSYQYVKANGGGTVTGNETLRDINPLAQNPLLPVSTANPTASNCRTVANGPGVQCSVGYLGGTPFFGRDVNGDGDTLDTVTVLAPSQTQTHRLGAIIGMRYELDEHNTFRFGYTYDRARHRQTGQVGLLQSNGEPFDVFPVNDPQKDSAGTVLQKRDRLSYAILHKVFAEYRGEFFDEKLVVNLGATLPFFKRNLTNNCFTSSAGGFVECFGTGQTAANTAAAALNPYTATTSSTGAIVITGWSPPQQRIFNYRRVLPNVGLIYRLSDNFSAFGNFSQGISVPGTDNLYQSFFFPLGTARAKPTPETTDNFDAGVRYRSGMVQAELSGFYNQFHNRLASAYDPELEQTVYRNLGSVKKYGLDGYVAIQPLPELTFYAFGSVLRSKIRDNIAIGENTDGTPIYALTAGKRESGAPTYSFGGTVRASVGPFDLGFTAKRTGPRYIFDNNEATFTGAFVPNGAKTSTGGVPVAPATPVKIYDDKAAAYWLVNLDARVNLSFAGLNDKTYLQLNVYNLFNQFYVGGFGGNLVQTNTYSRTTGTSSYGAPGFVQIGAPRTISGTVVFAF